MPLRPGLQGMVILRFTEAARVLISDISISPEKLKDKASLEKHFNQMF